MRQFQVYLQTSRYIEIEGSIFDHPSLTAFCISTPSIFSIRTWGAGKDDECMYLALKTIMSTWIHADGSLMGQNRAGITGHQTIDLLWTPSSLIDHLPL